MESLSRLQATSRTLISYTVWGKVWTRHGQCVAPCVHLADEAQTSRTVLQQMATIPVKLAHWVMPEPSALKGQHAQIRDHINDLTQRLSDALLVSVGSDFNLFIPCYVHTWIVEASLSRHWSSLKNVRQKLVSDWCL